MLSEWLWVKNGLDKSVKENCRIWLACQQRLQPYYGHSQQSCSLWIPRFRYIFHFLQWSCITQGRTSIGSLLYSFHLCIHLLGLIFNVYYYLTQGNDWCLITFWYFYIIFHCIFIATIYKYLVLVIHITRFPNHSSKHGHKPLSNQCKLFYCIWGAHINCILFLLFFAGSAH